MGPSNEHSRQSYVVLESVVSCWEPLGSLSCWFQMDCGQISTPGRVSMYAEVKALEEQKIESNCQLSESSFKFREVLKTLSCHSKHALCLWRLLRQCYSRIFDVIIPGKYMHWEQPKCENFYLRPCQLNCHGYDFYYSYHHFLYFYWVLFKLSISCPMGHSFDFT